MQILLLPSLLTSLRLIILPAGSSRSPVRIEAEKVARVFLGSAHSSEENNSAVYSVLVAEYCYNSVQDENPRSSFTKSKFIASTWVVKIATLPFRLHIPKPSQERTSRLKKELVHRLGGSR